MNMPKQTDLTDRELSRRRFVTTAAGFTAAIGAGALSTTHAAADDHNDDNGVTPAPRPIPGGVDLSGFGLSPPFDFIHIFSPGPAGVVLPFSGVTLEGLNVEPSVITDFSGATALAFVIGEATGSDGVTYGLEVDIRAMEGNYVAEDGSHQEGAFALI